MLGKAKDLKVKIFGEYYIQEDLERDINDFLEENPEIDVIDIKFSSSATNESWCVDALLIYKTK